MLLNLNQMNNYNKYLKNILLNVYNMKINRYRVSKINEDNETITKLFFKASDVVEYLNMPLPTVYYLSKQIPNKKERNKWDKITIENIWKEKIIGSSDITRIREYKVSS